MSVVKVQKPIIHIPSFEKYQTTAPILRAKLEALGLEIPMGMLDGQYYYTDLEGWGKVLYDLVFSSSLYKRDKFDCPLPEGLAFTMGLFFADGTCNFYPYCSSQWFIANNKTEFLERCIEPLEKEWIDLNFEVRTYPSLAIGRGKIKETAYRLITKLKESHHNGTRNKFVQDFRDMFYTRAGYKKVPGCILESPLNTKKAFLEGVIAGDGCKTQHRISILGKPGLRGLYLLMLDLNWHPYIMRDKRTENFYELGYGLRQDNDPFVLEYLEGRDIISGTDLARAFKKPYNSFRNILDRLEGKGFITSEKQCRNQRNIKLVKSWQPYCENYALKASNLVAEHYGLNTLAMAIGDIPEGRHAFNIFYHGAGFMLWEPNEGFPFSGSPFEIGDFGYKPEKILI